MVKGIVVSGARKAAFFTQLDWVTAQCEAKLGFRPFPGTLNIEILPESLPDMASMQNGKGIELVPPDTTSCTARVIPILIEEIRAAMIIPEEIVRIHGRNIVEAMAPVNLRQALNIEDGDALCLTAITGDFSEDGR